MEDYEELIENIPPESDDDNVYNIIKKSDEKKIKKLLYKSKHDPNLLPSYSTFNLRGKSYTLSNVSGTNVKIREKQKPIDRRKESEKEKKVLKKHEKNPLIPSLKEVYMKNPELLEVKTKKKKFKAPIPDINDIPLMNLTKDTNYIYDNAVEVIHGKISKPKKKNVVSVLDDDPLKKKDYGKISPYLIEIKKEIKEKEKLKKKEIIDETKIEKELEQKRIHLLEELKNKYNDINQEYLKISHVVDVNSVRKLKKKENYEKQLNQLEKDIQKLEIHS